MKAVLLLLFSIIIHYQNYDIYVSGQHITFSDHIIWDVFRVSLHMKFCFVMYLIIAFSAE